MIQPFFTYSIQPATSPRGWGCSKTIANHRTFLITCWGDLLAWGPYRPCSSSIARAFPSECHQFSKKHRNGLRDPLGAPRDPQGVLQGSWVSPWRPRAVPEGSLGVVGNPRYPRGGPREVPVARESLRGVLLHSLSGFVL